MTKIEDLPTELITYVTDHLRQAGDLVAFARTNRRLYQVVDPVLYKFAKTNVNGKESWHPLRWAAENGQTGTLRKALVAGMDANMLFNVTVDSMTRDMQSFQTRVEAIDGKAIWDPPLWDPTEEWRPTDDVMDHDRVARTMLEEQRTEFQPPRAYHSSGSMLHEDTDSDDLSDGMDYQHNDIIAGDPWAGSEPPDEPPGEGDENESVLGEEGARSMVRGFRAIHLAARGGHDDAVQVLLEHGANIDLCSRQLCNCDPGCARSHADSHGVPLHRTIIAGWSPLHLAICHFQTPTAKLLLSQGASVRLSEPRRDRSPTALHAAAATGQTDLCKHLLDHKYVSDVDVLDDAGLTPFYYAYFNGHWNTTVAFLLERGADIDFLIPHTNRLHPSLDNDRSTTLFEACYFGRYEDALKLIHLGADLRTGDYRDGISLQWPLHAACQLPNNFEESPRHPPLKLSAEADKNAHTRVKLIETMVRKGADVEVKSGNEEESPLHFAAKHDLASAVHALLAAGASVHVVNRQGRTPLMVSCVPEREQAHHSLMHALWCRSEENLINTLLDHGSDINKPDKNGYTALHLVCTMSPHLRDEQYDDDQRHERVARLLLERGANESARNKFGLTPFEMAFNNGCLQTCDILVRHRKNIKTLQNGDLHRMLLATIHDRPANLEAMNLLIDLDFDGFLYTDSIYIMRMVDGGHNKLACAYLERGTSMPPLTPQEKLTILHEAIESGVLALARRMLALKVSVNSVNKNGHTPLYDIISRKENTHGRDSLVEALLEAGADIHFRPSAGSLMTPLEKAIINREQRMVELMLHSQPLRSDSHAVLPPLAPKGVYLHAAARTFPSKHMFSALIRAGASVAELDANGDTPLAVFLRSVADQPAWVTSVRSAPAVVCATVWRLWGKGVDVNRRNKAGKSILGYLAALRLYSGRDKARVKIARELKRCVEVVPARGPGCAAEDKALEFWDEPLGVGVDE